MLFRSWKLKGKPRGVRFEPIREFQVVENTGFMKDSNNGRADFKNCRGSMKNGIEFQIGTANHRPPGFGDAFLILRCDGRRRGWTEGR